MAEKLTPEEYMRLEREIVTQQLPAELRDPARCKLCGQPHHLVKVNGRVAFYVHHGEELRTCRAIGYRTSFIGELGEALWRRVQANNDKDSVEPEHA